MATEVRTHLESAAARGLGEPDCVLLLGASRFPVHRAVVARGSVLLRQLLEEFGGSSGGGGEGSGAPPEVRLLSADGGEGGGATAGAAAASAAAANFSGGQLETFVTSFPTFLERLYSPTGTTPLRAGFGVAAARPMLELADFFDSPQLLPEIDNCLAASLPFSMELSGSSLVGSSASTCYYQSFWLTPAFKSCLELSVEFGLRRTMAEVLFLLSKRHLLKGCTTDAVEVHSCVDMLSAEPLAALTKLLLQEFPVTKIFPSCDGRCAGTDAGHKTVCPRCREAAKSARLQAVPALEKSLLERGWGYRRA